jgi:hypothetical protein
MRQLVPTIRDLRPYPESREAKALGCHCEVARRRGRRLFTRNGSPIFAIRHNCPVHDDPTRELVIWDGSTGADSGDRTQQKLTQLRGILKQARSNRRDVPTARKRNR